MKQVNLSIDGIAIEAKAGITILHAAREAGIIIPTLCHDDRLTAYGACRLCSVELDDGKKRRVVASCIYPVEEGLVVFTKFRPHIENPQRHFGTSPGNVPQR